jgi:hypothetical protein
LKDILVSVPCSCSNAPQYNNGPIPTIIVTSPYPSMTNNSQAMTLPTTSIVVGDNFFKINVIKESLSRKENASCTPSNLGKMTHKYGHSLFLCKGEFPKNYIFKTNIQPKILPDGLYVRDASMRCAHIVFLSYRKLKGIHSEFTLSRQLNAC